MSGKTSRRRRVQNSASQGSKQTVREEKRAQFEQPKSRTTLHLILAGIALAAVVAVAAVVLLNRDTGPAANAAPVAASGGDVSIPVAQVSDGQAHFYSYDAGGVQVKYFVIKGSNGKVRVALDACQVCYPQKKGYHQEGDVMVCNNCGRRFPANQIDVIRGGCNPIPLDHTVKNGTLVLATSALQSGAQYF